jgi:hypothetical protein
MVWDDKFHLFLRFRQSTFFSNLFSNANSTLIFSLSFNDVYSQVKYLHYSVTMVLAKLPLSAC